MGLGNDADYTSSYTPKLLEPIVRADKREALGIMETSLPFRGADYWNCYDFSWLTARGVPDVALVQFQVPCNSKNIIESKSLKLYLGSFSQSSFNHRNEVIGTLEKDLSNIAGGPVNVTLMQPDHVQHAGLGVLNGQSLDRLSVDIDEYYWNPDFLEVSNNVEVRETVYSHLLRTICPVTGQPDMASIQIQYQGRTISKEGLLKYIVSYRQHAEFCEQIVERIFVDIINRCQPERLSVMARYSRRGGLDINPYRSYEENLVGDVRLWRQ